MPARLTRPTVGLIPASPFEDEGQTIDPSVSVPIAAAHKFAEVPAPDPELDPQALRSRAYGFLVRPPRPLHPLVEWLERILAHSLRFVLPRITAPAARSFWATKESFGGFEPTSASEPAVVIILSAVSMLSLISTGTPWRGPRGPFALRSRSSSSAIARASGFSSMTLLMAGPCLSISSMRAVYFSTSERAVNFPDFMPSCSSEIAISSSSNAFTSGARAGDGGAGERSRAALSAGQSGASVAVAAPMTVFLRNERRFGNNGEDFGIRGMRILNGPGKPDQ